MKTLAAILLLAAASQALAVGVPTAGSAFDPAVMRIDEPRHLGSRLAGDTPLRDAEGRDFRLADILGKPVILMLSYYGCDGSCPTMNHELARVLEKVDRFRIGRDYRVLTVSFDARDTAGSAAGFLDRTGAVPPALKPGWRHAVLPRGDVQEFSNAVGFRFFWSDGAKAFLHPNVLVFLTPEGRIARYIYGFRLDAKTVELALTDADWDRISNSAAVFDMLAGVCFSYNLAEGRYQWNIPLLAGIGSLALGVTALGLGGWAYHRRRTAHG